jgi:hypothetical protein
MKDFFLIKVFTLLSLLVTFFFSHASGVLLFHAGLSIGHAFYAFIRPITVTRQHSYSVQQAQSEASYIGA